MEDIIITMAISTLLMTIKNGAKKAQLRSALLKLRNAISAAYPDSE